MIEQQIYSMIDIIDYINYRSNNPESKIGFYRAQYEGKLFNPRQECQMMNMITTIISKFKNIRSLSEDDIFKFIAILDTASRLRDDGMSITYTKTNGHSISNILTVAEFPKSLNELVELYDKFFEVKDDIKVS